MLKNQSPLLAKTLKDGKQNKGFETDHPSPPLLSKRDPPSGGSSTKPHHSRKHHRKQTNLEFQPIRVRRSPSASLNDIYAEVKYDLLFDDIIL